MNNLRSEGDTREADQRELVRHRIHNGVLPTGPGERVFGGHGTGAACTCCDLPIEPDQIEFEVEFGFGGQPPRILLMHSHCLRLWYDLWVEEAGRG